MGLKAIRAAIAAAIQKRNAAQAALVVCRDNESSTAEEITTATVARDAIDSEITTLQARETELVAEETREAELVTLMNRVQPGAGAVPEARRSGSERAPGDGVVRSEPRTYSSEADRTGEASFFADLYRSTKPGTKDFAAEQRLQRHDTEVRVEREAHGRYANRATTTASYGGLIPPQYLVDEYALLARAGRPYANSVVQMELPDTGMSFIIPRGTTGATAAIQSTQNTAVSNTDEAWTDLTIPVATIAGQQDISRQSLERGTPGIDRIVFADIVGAYACERRPAGSVRLRLVRPDARHPGHGGHRCGHGLRCGADRGQLHLQARRSARRSSPSLVRARPSSRASWSCTRVGGAGSSPCPTRPAVRSRWRTPWVRSTPRVSSACPAATRPTARRPARTASTTSASSPTACPSSPTPTSRPTVGTNVEDVVLVLDTRQLLLWEQGDGMPKQLRFEQTLGNQLTVKMVVYGYAAFTAGRYPVASAKVGGLDSTATFGLVAPTF
jgi:hypothetical protein